MTDYLTLNVGPMAHGGHCIARHEGRVVFLRHAVPGETVRAVVTEGESGSKFWRADVVDVLDASDHRRRHPWKQADALRAYDHSQLPVGGADYGHISDMHQRRLKSHVFRDTLQRIGGLNLGDLDIRGLGADGELPAQNLGGERSDGLHWRSRVSFAVTDGSLAMKPYRSHDLIPLRSMPLAVEAVGASGIFSWDFDDAKSVDVVAPGGSGPITLVVTPTDDQNTAALQQRLRDQAESSTDIASVLLSVPAAVAKAAQRNGRRRGNQRQARATRDYQVISGDRTVEEPLPRPTSLASPTSSDSLSDPASLIGATGPSGQRSQKPEASGSINQVVHLPPEGFWQIHRRAPQALVNAVHNMAELAEGDTAVDLYAGAGLFTAWAAERVGPTGKVLSIEAAPSTSQAAQQLFATADHVDVVRSPVEKVAGRLESVNLLLLDPPRSGAGKQVLHGINESSPEQIIYVSCDPASFARDAKILSGMGWQLTDMALLDMYPNTHHMESVARFSR